jgi:hypothetical protein
MTAASVAEGVIAFMNAAFGLRLAADFLAGFFAGAFFGAAFLAADFFAAGFFAADFFAAGFFADFFAAFFAVAMVLLPVIGASGRCRSFWGGPPVTGNRSIGGDYTAFPEGRKAFYEGKRGAVVTLHRGADGMRARIGAAAGAAARRARIACMRVAAFRSLAMTAARVR